MIEQVVAAEVGFAPPGSSEAEVSRVSAAELHKAACGEETTYVSAERIIRHHLEAETKVVLRSKLNPIESLYERLFVCW